MRINAADHRQATGTHLISCESRAAGKAIKSLPREKVVICDKWGPIFKPNQPPGFDASKEAGRRRIDATLKRLGVDFIDVWILRLGGKPTGLEESITVMKVSICVRLRKC